MVEDSCICNCATSYISATVLRYTFLFYAKGYDKLKIAMDHVTPRVKILHPLFFKITLTQCNYSDYSCGYKWSFRATRMVYPYDATHFNAHLWTNTLSCLLSCSSYILGNDSAQNLICRKTQRAMTDLIY